MPIRVLAQERAEDMLERVITLVKAGQRDEALKLARELNRRYANFRLGQLLLGDLLSAGFRPLSEVGDVSSMGTTHVNNVDSQGNTTSASNTGSTASTAEPNAASPISPTRSSRSVESVAEGKPSAQQTLEQLRQEFLLRSQAVDFQPHEGQLPLNLLSVGADIPSAVLVDTSKSRLYLFKRNANGVLRLVRDYYATQGLLGDNKSIEGDKRTPLGIYLTTGRINAQNLAPLYGAGALPLNYPNPVDQRHGKTGSGIWIHGVPFNTYARLPRESDGCVALANADLLELRDQIVPMLTPVVITNGAQWLSPSSLDERRREFLSTWEAWRQALGAPDLQRLFYAPDLAEKLPSQSLTAGSLPGNRDITIVYARNGDEQIMVRFTLPGLGEVIRQYWLKQSGIWQIVSEQRSGGVHRDKLASLNHRAHANSNP